MGVCLVAQTLSDEKIDAIMADPALVWRIVSPDDTEFYLQEIGQDKPPGLLEKIFGQKRDWPPVIPQFTYVENEYHELDMDKAWDGANFCVKKLVDKTQCPNFFEDGTPVGKVEVGYGPALCFKSTVVATIAQTYGAISEQQLKQAYVPAQMGDVYLDQVWQEDGDEGWQYLLENFLELQAFLRQAAQYRLGVVVQYT